MLLRQRKKLKKLWGFRNRKIFPDPPATNKSIQNNKIRAYTTEHGDFLFFLFHSVLSVLSVV